MKHPQAKILHAFADGEVVQFWEHNGNWIDINLREFSDYMKMYYEATLRFRVKPSLVVVNGMEIPPPTKGTYGLIVNKSVYYNDRETDVTGNPDGCIELWFPTAGDRDAAFTATVSPFVKQRPKGWSDHSMEP